MLSVRLVMFSSGLFFFVKQKTAYEMRISDWSSDVCSSDLSAGAPITRRPGALHPAADAHQMRGRSAKGDVSLMSSLGERRAARADGRAISYREIGRAHV